MFIQNKDNLFRCKRRKTMKVILTTDIKGVGKKDQVINASDGYARNFLFPKKLAVLADKENMAKLQMRKDSANHKKEMELEEARKVKEELAKRTLTIKVKTGENGKLFGSITAKEIAENLEQQYKIKVDKKKVNIKEAIKELGTVTVPIKLYEGVIATLQVNVEKM